MQVAVSSQLQLSSTYPHCRLGHLQGCQQVDQRLNVLPWAAAHDDGLPAMCPGWCQSIAIGIATEAVDTTRVGNLHFCSGGSSSATKSSLQPRPGVA